jgi:hypothetical protein
MVSQKTTEGTYEHGWDKIYIEPKRFKQALQDAGIKKMKGKLVTREGHASKWVWEAEGMQVATWYNPITGEPADYQSKDPEYRKYEISVGGAYYMGITGNMKQAKMFVKYMKKYAEFEDESKGRRDFI